MMKDASSEAAKHTARAISAEPHGRAGVRPFNPDECVSPVKLGRPKRPRREGPKVGPFRSAKLDAALDDDAAAELAACKFVVDCLWYSNTCCRHAKHDDENPNCARNGELHCERRNGADNRAAIFRIPLNILRSFCVNVDKLVSADGTTFNARNCKRNMGLLHEFCGVGRATQRGEDM